MATITRDLDEEISHELRNLKTANDKDQVVIVNLLKNDSLFNL